MATLKIMYWKEIPAQVQAEDDSGRVSKLLDGRFQEGIDAISMFDGSAGNDDYLEAWNWGEPVEVAGTAEEAAAQITARFNGGFPRDFVERIRELKRAGRRDPRPGAVDHWAQAGA